MKNALVVTIYFLIIMSLHLMGCSNAYIVDDAIKKHGAAIYYYEQKDFVNARKYCLKAKELWMSLKKVKSKLTEDWSVDRHIEICDELLESLPYTKPLEGVIDLPIRIAHSMIIVEVMLNQKEKVNLILDTGASCSVINPTIAEKLTIYNEDSKHYTVKLLGEKTVEMPFSKISDVRLGEAVVYNMRVGIFEAFPGWTTVDGLLGADFLQHFIMTVDLKKKRLKLIGFKP